MSKKNQNLTSKKNKVFVTGSCGFIGFQLCKNLLKQNFLVMGYDGITDYYDVSLKKARNDILLQDQNYTFQKGSFDGIGKFYKGREISHVMGYQGINWLERPEREKEENTSRLIKNMNIVI